MLDPDPHDILPEDATILDYGIDARSAWAAFHFGDYGQYWGAVDFYRNLRRRSSIIYTR